MKAALVAQGAIIGAIIWMVALSSGPVAPNPDLDLDPAVPAQESKQGPTAIVDPVRAPGAERTEGERYLELVVDQLGVPDFLPDYPPHSLGQYIADIHAAPQYATRMDALADRLSGDELAHILECIGEMMATEELPQDYLSAPLDEKAAIWDPVGRDYAEGVILSPLGASQQAAKRHFLGRLLEVYRLPSQNGQASLDYTVKSKDNPEVKPIPESVEVGLKAIEVSYGDRMRELILGRSLVDEYMLAREVKLAAEDYIALPFNAMPILAGCQSRSSPGLLGLTVSHTSGWSVAMEVKRGDNPLYDALMDELLGLKAARDAELSAMIASLP
ncbi:MAG: hypothetical protein P1V81_09760 [Planctomycetota bacterium]|nr:hypothetical protein [Planctomycetota bacterium]